MEQDWDALRRIAEEEVEATLSGLPPPLQERARVLTVTLERHPNPAHVEDGIEPDTLGLFVGPEFAFEDTSALPLPPQIILFLNNLWELSESDEDIFRQEIRRTYMHELGHYLGLNEDDLLDRGLE